MRIKKIESKYLLEAWRGDVQLWPAHSLRHLVGLGPYGVESTRALVQLEAQLKWDSELEDWVPSTTSQDGNGHRLRFHAQAWPRIHS